MNDGKIHIMKPGQKLIDQQIEKIAKDGEALFDMYFQRIEVIRLAAQIFEEQFDRIVSAMKPNLCDLQFLVENKKLSDFSGTSLTMLRETFVLNYIEKHKGDLC